MKKLTLLILLLSLGLSHTSYAGIVKSNQDNNPSSVDINIHSDVDIYGVQFDLDYESSALVLSEAQITSLVNSADVYSKILEPGKARVIMFSMQGDRVMSSADNLASIINIAFTADGPIDNPNVSISNLILAGANGISVDCAKEATYDGSLNLPEETSLGRNYPNPFNPSTTIPINISQSGNVTLKVYDMSGSLVKTLSSDYKAAGSYKVVWNGLNNDGQQVASGQYILKMSAPNYTNTMQMTFVK
tara:strand:+ start:80 stop:817 length:738 start_codon:yes stop_codon:yes gene_type:complete